MRAMKMSLHILIQYLPSSSPQGQPIVIQTSITAKDTHLDCELELRELLETQNHCVKYNLMLHR